MNNTTVRTVLSALLLLSGLGGAWAQPAPINFDARIDASSILRGLKLAVVSTPVIEGVGKDAAPQKTSGVSAKRSIRVSGRVRLSGTSHVRREGGFVHMNLSDSVRLDVDGDYRANTLWVRENLSVYVRKGTSHVSEHVRIWERVSIYDNSGKFVGTVTLQGSIWVSGWNSNNWLRLSGSGNISGTLYID